MGNFKRVGREAIVNKATSSYPMLSLAGRGPAGLSNHPTNCRTVRVATQIPHVAAVQPSDKKKDRIEIRALHASVAGMTLPNADGTQRQDILAHVAPGQPLTIEKGIASSGNGALFLRHERGVIGVLKASILQEFAMRFPDAAVIVRVVQLTVGTDVNSTLDCSIVLACAPPGEGQSVEEILAITTDPLPRKQLSPDIQVYLDSARKLFHCDMHCSGMKGAIQVGLRSAVYQYHACPCRRCVAKGLLKCLGKDQFNIFLERNESYA